MMRARESATREMGRALGGLPGDPRAAVNHLEQPSRVSRDGRNPAREEIGAPETEFTYRRIGHKGAAALEMGNTVDSFEAAVEVGVDMIEPTCCGPGGG